MNKTPREVWELIEGIAENSQQFGTREDVPTRKMNEMETSSIQLQLTELTSFVRQLAVGNASQAKVCGICTAMGHSTEMCLMIQEESAEQVNMAGHVPASRKHMTRIRIRTIQVGKITLTSAMEKIRSQILHKIDSKSINNIIKFARHHPLQTQVCL